MGTMSLPHNLLSYLTHDHLQQLSKNDYFLYADMIDGDLPQLSPELQRDPEVILSCLQINGRSLENVPYDMRTRAYCVEACLAHFEAYDFVPVIIAHNPTFCVELISRKGSYLQNFPRLFPPHLKSTVMGAVQQNGSALQWAAALQDDYDIVLAAICQSGQAIQFASPPLQANPKLQIVAIATGGHAALHHLRPPVSQEQRMRTMREFMADRSAFKMFLFGVGCPGPVWRNEALLQAFVEGDDQRSYVMFLSAMYKKHKHELNLIKRQCKPENPCVLTKLTCHGPHFALRFKKSIAEFIGVPMGRFLTFLLAAMEAPLTHQQIARPDHLPFDL